MSYLPDYTSAETPARLCDPLLNCIKDELHAAIDEVADTKKESTNQPFVVDTLYALFRFTVSAAAGRHIPAHHVTDALMALPEHYQVVKAHFAVWLESR